MGMLVRAAVLLSPLLFCNAFLDLTGPNEIEGMWKESTTLPCAYVPVEDFVQQTLTWTVVHDQSSGTIFRRDGSGDHILLSEYRDRVSVPKDAPGNVSLHILNLEVSDRGTYTCQVTWRASNNSLITKEITTKMEVVKVAVTKPVIRAGKLGLTVPAGARTSLTCVASGSPPISYRWFRSSPGGKAQLLSSQAELAWDSLRLSDAGMYYCEAENRVGDGAVQQSDAVELRVREFPASWQPSPGTGRHSRPPPTPRGDAPQPVPTDLPPAATLGSRRDAVSERRDAVSEGPPIATGPPPAALPPHLYALAAALGGVALGALAAALLLRRLRKKKEPAYEVAFYSTADVTRLETDMEVPVKCLQEETNSKTETANDTFTMKDNRRGSICIRKNPEYENLVTAMESEFETEKNY